MAVRPIDGNDFMRQLTLDTSKGHYGEFMDGSEVAYTSREIAKFVEDMPTLTLPNEWVSVEERSPKLRENVLVCAYWHEHWGVYMGWNSGHGWYVSCGLGQRSDVKVSHWMPLPAPPDRRPTAARRRKMRTHETDLYYLQS